MSQRSTNTQVASLNLVSPPPRIRLSQTQTFSATLSTQQLPLNEEQVDQREYEHRSSSRRAGGSECTLSGGKSILSDWLTLDEVAIDRVPPPKLCAEFVSEPLMRMCPEVILTNEGVLWAVILLLPQPWR